MTIERRQKREQKKGKKEEYGQVESHQKNLLFENRKIHQKLWAIHNAFKVKTVLSPKQREVIFLLSWERYTIDFIAKGFTLCLPQSVPYEERDVYIHVLMLPGGKKILKPYKNVAVN